MIEDDDYNFEPFEIPLAGCFAILFGATIVICIIIAVIGYLYF